MDVMVAPGAIDGFASHLSVRSALSLPEAPGRASRPAVVSSAVRAGAERAVALLLLAVLSPVLLSVAVAVRLGGPGPVFFRQTRVGRRGESFRMLKFRTMVEDAETQRHRLVAHNHCDAVLFKIRSDPRTTGVGRQLRRFSLDELPQLWHVVTGRMAFVGPRPALPAEVAQYSPDTARRLSVKPGLTGLWQVNGRSNLSWEDSIRLDLHYVDNRSPTGDLAILMRTLGVVLRGDGAY